MKEKESVEERAEDQSVSLCFSWILHIRIQPNTTFHHSIPTMTEEREYLTCDTLIKLNSHGPHGRRIEIRHISASRLPVRSRNVDPSKQLTQWSEKLSTLYQLCRLIPEHVTQLTCRSQRPLTSM